MALLSPAAIDILEQLADGERHDAGPLPFAELLELGRERLVQRWTETPLPGRPPPTRVRRRLPPLRSEVWITERGLDRLRRIRSGRRRAG